MNILIVAAHPDDEVLGCGGTIPRLVKDGHEVTIAILGEGITSRYQDRNEADQDLVAAHAIELNDNSYASVRLEGHADERGSREYNIGLGERRAQAVRQMLMIQGVNAAQIQTVSFGEERPDAMGGSESDYARNRRVEIKYSN